ncbi:MAG: ABC-type transport auxiliary lipoprotein family protein [Pseudomonadota bacterium]
MAVSQIFKTVSAAIGLSACASAPDPVLYVLDTVSPSSDFASGDTLISLAEVRLPSYARDQKITSLDGQNRVVKDGDHRWASPPEEALTLRLAAALEEETGVRVLVRPVPSGLTPDFSLTVSFDELMRGEAGEAIARGQFTLVGFDQISSVERFDFTIQTGDRNYDGFMRGVSRAIERLSEQIGNDLDDFIVQSPE